MSCLVLGGGHVPYWNWGRIKILRKPLPQQKLSSAGFWENVCFFKKTSTIQQQERRKSRVDKLEILGTRVELYMTNVKENPNSAFSLKPCSGVTSHCAFFNTTSVRGSKIKNRKKQQIFFKTHKNDVNTNGFLCRDWTNWILWESWLCR